jgi:hypothetical protein
MDTLFGVITKFIANNDVYLKKNKKNFINFQSFYMSIQKNKKNFFYEKSF